MNHVGKVNQILSFKSETNPQQVSSCFAHIEFFRIKIYLLTCEKYIRIFRMLTYFHIYPALKKYITQDLSTICQYFVNDFSIYCQYFVNILSIFVNVCQSCDQTSSWSDGEYSESCTSTSKCLYLASLKDSFSWVW